MPGTSILRSDYFFLFFFRSPLSPFPCLALFFPGLVSIDLRAFYLFFGYFSIFFFTEFRLSWDLFLWDTFRHCLRPREVEELVACRFYFPTI